MLGRAVNKKGKATFTGRSKDLIESGMLGCIARVMCSGCQLMAITPRTNTYTVAMGFYGGFPVLVPKHPLKPQCA